MMAKSGSMGLKAVILRLPRKRDDGDDGAGVFACGGVTLGVRGDGDAGIILKKASVNEGVFSGAEDFGAVRFDGVKGGC